MNAPSPVEREHKGLIAWMVHNSIAAHLIMFLLLGGGAWTAITMQKEVDPEFALDTVDVRVAYPGAAPAEVEQGILLPVEEAARGVPGIKEIRSTAREGSGSVQFELVSGVDRIKAADAGDVGNHLTHQLVGYVGDLVATPLPGFQKIIKVIEHALQFIGVQKWLEILLTKVATQD